MSEKVKKIINNIISVIVVVFLVFAVLITIMAFSTLKNTDGIPSIGGYALLTVESDSMAPTFKAGDLIIGKKITDAEDAKNFVEGDVITFTADLDGDGTYELNTHRIVSKTVSGENVSYKTKGDNNALEDSYTVYSSEVRCSWGGTNKDGIKLAKMGSFINFLKSSTGFLVCIVLPLALFFVYELVHFVMTVMKIKAEDADPNVKAQISELEEENIKRKAIEEYLKQQAEEAAKAQAEAAEAAPSTETEPAVEETPASENTEE